VSAQTIYTWRKHFGSLESTDVKRLRQLEQENGRLKKMVADRDLEIVSRRSREKNGGRTRARQQVAYAEGRGLSRRRACALLSVARSTLGYVSRLVARDASVFAPLRALAGQYPTVRLPDDPDFPRATGAHARHRSHVSPVAAGTLASAEEVAAAARGGEPSTAGDADRGESRVGVRLRIRHLR
jgi:putative transposase